jgi:hypothetical protein
MRKLILLMVVFFFLGVSSARARDIYIARSASGAANGAGCGDAFPYTFFNDGSHWPSPIGPGTTVHICGTITASAGTSGLLTFQGSGIPGNPITLKFETGAVLTAPYWGPNGAIYATGQNYITIDGGTNGLIQATANGTNLENHQDGRGVFINPGNNVEIENLTVANIYVHACSAPVSSCTDTRGGNSGGIYYYGGNSVLIHNNTVHDASSCIVYAYPGGAINSSVSIYNNTISNCNWQINVGDGNTNAILNGVLIYGNNISGFGNWNTSSNTFHNDGIFVFATHIGSVISGLMVYNNYLLGPFGPCCTTAFLYMSANLGGGGGLIAGSFVFNNVFDYGSASTAGDGLVYDWASGSRYYNNTFIAGQNNDILVYGWLGSLGTVMENNILTSSGTPSTNLSWTNAGTLAISDYNDFYGASSVAFNNGTYSSTLANWKLTLGNPDTHSVSGNPNLDSSYVPRAGSAAIGAGTSLYSICGGQPNPGLGALCYDKAGNPRSSSSPSWDAGSMSSGSSASLPAPPTGLTATRN